MSFWQEGKTQAGKGKAETVEAVFRIDCARLPVDHADGLAAAICRTVPWLRETANASIQAVHVAGSQNGWARPEACDDEWLILSRRTRLRIRVQREHAERLISDLGKQELQIAGQRMLIKAGEYRELQSASNLFSRYTWFADNGSGQDANSADSENRFVEQVVAACNAIGYSPNKVLCGKTQRIRLQQCDSNMATQLDTRSVLLADVPDEYSLLLQDRGLGEHRLLGCGLLIPHKDTAPVNQAN